MSLKDLFGKTSEKIVANKQLQDLYKEAESEGYLEEVAEDRERFLPAVDFTSASNFARYGSAEKYYVDAIANIYQNYPYDGSKKEKQDWRNKATQLDLYIFDNIYPKTTGYISLGSGSYFGTTTGSYTYKDCSKPQYVKIKGGPNPSPTGEFEKSNIYDLSTNRESNLGISSLGNTVEFWHKENIPTTSPVSEFVHCLFDLWNNKLSGSSDYARLTIEHSSSNTFLLTYVSGTSGIVRYPISYAADRNNWHHYAFSFKNSFADVNTLEVSLYIDGNLVSLNNVVGAGSISLGNNLGLIANIGAYQADSEGKNSTFWNGLGTSYSSYDEFRFWKEARTSKQIYRYWFTSIAGGSNTDNANTALGVYYKFNEGKINASEISALDSVCIDYSGRASNGTIISYDLNVKSTSSAIDLYFGEEVEPKDPILFSINPLVKNIIDQYAEIGFEYDKQNNSNIYNSIPSWISEEAEKLESNDLSHLVQIISSYFDTLHLQIKDLPALRNVEYTQSGQKPKPFTNRLLSSYGFENLEIFNDTTFLEDVLSRNESDEFEEKIHNIKNTIYQNIYNNLAYIYKSKGTEKSLRNLIRCFGVDDELIKINLYASNSEYEFTEKYKSVSIPKKYVDFNNADRYNGYVFQKNISLDSDTRGHIKGSNSGKLDYVPLTLQTEVIFPKKVLYDDPNYDIPVFTDISLFGLHTCKDNDADLTWGDDVYNQDLFNFQVYAIKRNFESPDVYFKLVARLNNTNIVLTSSYYNDTYDNQKWNFAIRLYPQKLENTNTTIGSDNTDYVFDFIGYNSILDSLQNDFCLSTAIPSTDAKVALNANKRLYVGAHYENFNESYLKTKTDVKISSVRYWLDYLNNEELRVHSFDASNAGRQYPNWPMQIIATGSYSRLARIDTLALNWDFFNVSSSDSYGQFLVQDISSGSLAETTDNFYALIQDITKIRHTGLGNNFYPNDDQVVNKEYVYSAKQLSPEVVAGSDLVQTPITDDVTRTKTSRPINFYLSVEKSMAQVINDEILNWFATIKDFNNLVGDPIEKYQYEYKALNHMKRMFFEKVQNTPDFEKFLEFYKWIDSSISMMISQLVPASANISNKVRNIIESHLLERNKYQNKLPNLQFNGEMVTSVGSGLNFEYEKQKAPASPAGTLWLKQRVERSNTLVSTPLEPQNDIDREVIRQVTNSKNLNKVPVLYSVDAGENYDGMNDKIRFFNQIYRFVTDQMTIIEDTVSPITVNNAKITSRFKFADETITGSGQIVQPLSKKQNYYQNYEYLQAVGRTANNKSFVDLTGTITSTEIDSGYSFSSQELPVRSTYKNIFVERFSAPGGPETLSRGALDNAAEEYSAYNDLNARNLRVRKQLNVWSAESKSLDSVNPSLHKVNKNPGYRPLNTSSANSVARYDNDFIQHQIPQSDLGYAWISSSLSTRPKFSGYVGGYSNLNTYNTSSFQFVSGATSGSKPLDFVGLNTHITKDIDLSNFIVSTGSNFDNDLNKHLLNLNGAYKHPSWKQIRKDGNKIVQNSIKNNLMLVVDKPLQRFKDVRGFKIPYTEQRAQTAKSYKQSPVTFNKPMKHTLLITGSESSIEVVSTYDNNKEKFNNQDLAFATGISDKKDFQAHDALLELQGGLFDPKPEILKAEYTTQIYPAKENTGLKEIRTKPNYDDFGSSASVVDLRSYWHENYQIRKRMAEVTDLFNYTTSSYSALKDFTGSIMNTYPVINEISGNINHSIFALDNLTGSGPAYTGTLINDWLPNPDPMDGEQIDINNAFLDNHLAGVSSVLPYFSAKMTYGDTQKGILAPYNLPEHRYFILDPDYNNNRFNYIAKWDPQTNLWSDDGIPKLNGPVTALYYDNNSNRLYAGGFFTEDEFGNNLDQIAYWDGNQWNRLGLGVTASNNMAFNFNSFPYPFNDIYNSLFGGIRKIISGSNGIYFTGFFDKTSDLSKTLNGVARWNAADNTIQNISSGILFGSSLPYKSGVGTTIHSNSSGIFIGGIFNKISSSTGFLTCNGITKWNGNDYSLLGTGVNNGASSFVFDIANYGNNSIIIGGLFNEIAGSSIDSKGVGIYNYSSNIWTAAPEGGVLAEDDSTAWVTRIKNINNNVVQMAGTIYKTANNTGANAPLGSITVLVSSSGGGYWKPTDSYKNVSSYITDFNGSVYDGDVNVGANLSIAPFLSTNEKNYNAFLFNSTEQKFISYSSDLNNNVSSIVNSASSNCVYYSGFFTGQTNRKSMQTSINQTPFDAYSYSSDRLLPRPQIIFNNHLPSSTGSVFRGLYMYELNEDKSQKIITYNKTFGECVYLLNEGYIYDTDKVAGDIKTETGIIQKKPFFNSYDDFLRDLKPSSKKYSIIPEYKISDFAQYFIKEKNGNFNSYLTSSYLSLDGLAIQNNFTDINSELNRSTTLNTFIYDESANNKKISFKISGIKKLLPYKGFYPSERVKELSSKFINSFMDLKKTFSSVYSDVYTTADYNNSNGTPIDQQILTLIQPLFAPGILLNSIKSSIAVDWPTFITNSVAYSSSVLPEFYASSGSVNTNHTATLFINQEPNYRFEFESLLEYDTTIPDDLKTTSSNLYYLDPTYYSTDVVYGEDRQYLRYPSYNMSLSGSLKNFVFNNADYKLAMHNFLAEVPSFFLKNQLSKLVSLPENKYQSAIAGVTYYMDVVLERDNNFKEYIADPFYESAKLLQSGSNDLLIYSPDSLYGPPVRYWNYVNASELTSSSWYKFFFKQIDTPAYAPYVPPYYYGKSIARIAFKAEDTRQYSLEEIQRNATITFINNDAQNLFAERSNYISSSFSAPYKDNYSDSPAYKSLMTLSSSINLLFKTENNTPVFDAQNSKLSAVQKPVNENNSWVIQTKFETPAINFAKVDTTNNIGLNFVGGFKDNELQFTHGIYSSTFKGLWTTYGQPVKEGEGIKLFISEPFIGSKRQMINSKTGSLAQLCGFKKDQKLTIGLLGDNKKISEGVVIIPYTYKNNHEEPIDDKIASTIPEIIGENGVNYKLQRANGPFYFQINRDILKEVIGLSFSRDSLVTFDEIKRRINSSEIDQNNSIVKLVKAMTTYVIPPHLDWIRNKEIDPFVMYIAEFDTILDTEDLSDIWQGLMPKPSYKAEKQEINISHNFGNMELFHGKKLPSEVKFKVFKVKQRAEINYYKLTEDSKDDTRFKFNFGNSNEANSAPEYSYNWPYDFFSLVELVNIDVKLEVDNTRPIAELIENLPKINKTKLVASLEKFGPKTNLKAVNQSTLNNKKIKTKINRGD